MYSPPGTPVPSTGVQHPRTSRPSRRRPRRAGGATKPPPPAPPAAAPAPRPAATVSPSPPLPSHGKGGGDNGRRPPEHTKGMEDRNVIHPTPNGTQHGGTEIMQRSGTPNHGPGGRLMPPRFKARVDSGINPLEISREEANRPTRVHPGIPQGLWDSTPPPPPPPATHPTFARGVRQRVRQRPIDPEMGVETHTSR